MNLSKCITHFRPGAQWTLNGDNYDGLVWHDKVQTKPTLAECEAAWAELTAPKPPPPVVVTMRSFRLALGRTRYIELMAFVGAIPDAEQKFQVQTMLDYEPYVSRVHPMVLQFASALNKSDTEVDSIFTTAAQLDLTA